MNLLLSAADVVIPLVIIFLIFGVAAVIVVFLKRKYGNDRGMITKDIPKTVYVEIKKCYLKPEEVSFLKSLTKVLPAEFVAYPKVGVDNLVQPKNDKVLYNTILSQYIDVCVFLRTTMEPILAIDLFSASPVEQQMKKLHPNVIKAMQTVKIPLIQYQISEEYNLIELRTKVIEAMPSKMVAMLKDKVKNDTNF
ncbi:MAG: DUF2726 domain-containing protein [Clostridia bacterium]|nr:DUF2726 domain-containing protein [Clostridia bacterium]